MGREGRGWGGGSWAALLGAALVLAGCEQIVQRREFNRFKDDIRREVGEAREQAKQAARASARVEELSRSLRKELADNLGPLREAQANQERRVEEMRREVQKLTDRFEKGAFRAQQVGEEVKKLREETQKRLGALEGEVAALKARPKPPPPTAAVPPPPPSAPPGPATPPRPEAPPGALRLDVGSPEVEYGAALRVLREARKYEQARQMFQEFLKRYPKSELADNAQYWIGESYYVERSYEKAILAFVEVQTRYPKGDKVPDALLKQALAFKALGDKRSARDLLRQVVRDYPNSNAAKIAQGHLRGL